MPVAMATDKRLRVSFDAESESLRRAVHIAAAMQGRSHNDILNELIKTHLAEYVTLAERAIAEDDPKPRKRKAEN